MWLTKLERLADPKYGLRVRFEPGWRTRGASGGDEMRSVQGVLWHHDVSPRTGTYPLRRMLREGRPGLTGPLCHIGFDRDGTVWVVGAGKANHAGTGKVPGVPRNGGNRRLIGIEMTSAGTRPWDWTDAQLRQMPRLGAALSDIFGLSVSQHWAHYEYQDGKIDPAGLPGAMPGLRSRIDKVRFLSGVPGAGASVPGGSYDPTPEYDPDRLWRTSPRVAAMTDAEVREIQSTLHDLGYNLGQWGVDGSYGDATGHAVKQLQQDLDITADGVYGPGTEKTLMSKLDTIISKIDAYGEQNQWRLDTLPQRILDAPVELEGAWEGQTATLRSMRAWYAEDLRQIKAGIAQSRTAVLEAVQETGRAQGLTDAQVQAIAEAAAEASARVSAEDVADRLEVTTRED